MLITLYQKHIVLGKLIEVGKLEVPDLNYIAWRVPVLKPLTIDVANTETNLVDQILAGEHVDFITYHKNPLPFDPTAYIAVVDTLGAYRTPDKSV